METTNFPESQGSAKLSGTSSNGTSTGLGMGSTGGAADIGASSTGTSNIGASNYATAGDTPAMRPTRFVSMAHNAVDKMAELANRYSERQNQAMEASKTMVRDKPLMALGAAVAVAFLVGRLTSR